MYVRIFVLAVYKYKQYCSNQKLFDIYFNTIVNVSKCIYHRDKHVIFWQNAPWIPVQFVRMEE